MDYQIVKIIVEGGCVLDVVGLPPGYIAIIEDHDTYDEGDEWDIRPDADGKYFGISDEDQGEAH